MDNLSMLFGLLSDPARLKLLGLLSSGERCVCKLYEPLGLQQSTVSRHLSLMKTAGIVASRRVGTWMHYRIAPELWKVDWNDVLPAAISSAAKQLKLNFPEIECCDVTAKKNGTKRKATATA